MGAADFVNKRGNALIKIRKRSAGIYY